MIGVVVVPEVAAGQDAGAMDRHRLDDDHAGPAERPFAVVADVPFAGQTALGHVRGMGAEGDPAAERAMAELERFEDVGERRPSCDPGFLDASAAASRRRRNASNAMTPPIEVVARITRWTRRPSANAESRGIPRLSAIATTVSSNVPTKPGPAGTIVASATPLVISAAWATVSGTPTAWPAARKVTDRGGPGERAEGERRRDDPRPAGDGETLAQPASELEQARTSRDQRGHAGRHPADDARRSRARGR